MDEALLREMKQKALYRACMFFVSDFDEKFTADQIIEAIWNESSSVTLWEAVEHMHSEEIVEMIDGLANDFVQFALEYIKKMSPGEVVHKVENENKKIEQHSGSSKGNVDESYHASRYSKAVTDFTRSAVELVNVWESIPSHLEPKITHNQTYPFGMSFDEMVYGIICWNSDVQETIEKWRKDNGRET
jgi:hypothetical protein